LKSEHSAEAQRMRVRGALEVAEGCEFTKHKKAGADKAWDHMAIFRTARTMRVTIIDATTCIWLSFEMHSDDPCMKRVA
jgi:hypothetical protein